jgi:hypothetical protein
MLPNIRDKAGVFPAWMIAVLALVILSALMFGPIAASQTTLEDSLGADIQTETLPL